MLLRPGVALRYNACQGNRCIVSILISNKYMHDKNEGVDNEMHNLKERGDWISICEQYKAESKKTAGTE